MSAAGHREIEVKIPCPAGADAALALIQSRGYRITAPRLFESNTLFDRESGELRAGGQLLRLRITGGIARVTYKGPGEAGRHKSREEIEFDVSDANAFVLVLQRLGYRPGFEYEKYRTTFGAAGEPGEITLDETPIGVFLELEGDPDWIDRTAARLGFSESDYVTLSYASLYQEYLRKHPGGAENMKF
jgi:adenylate cyclase class 2